MRHVCPGSWVHKKHVKLQTGCFAWPLHSRRKETFKNSEIPCFLPKFSLIQPKDNPDYTIYIRLHRDLVLGQTTFSVNLNMRENDSVKERHEKAVEWAGILGEWCPQAKLSVNLSSLWRLSHWWVDLWHEVWAPRIQNLPSHRVHGFHYRCPTVQNHLFSSMMVVNYLPFLLFSA